MKKMLSILSVVLKVLFSLVLLGIRANFIYTMQSARTIVPNLWWLYSLDVFTVGIIIYLLYFKKISFLNGIVIYSFLGLFYTFYSLCWSRIIIKNAIGIVSGLLFSFNNLYFVFFIISYIFAIFLLYRISKNFFDAFIISILFLSIFVLISLYFKYNNVEEIAAPYSNEYRVFKVIENSKQNQISVLPNLRNGTDVRVIYITESGLLVGAGGNWLVSEIRDVLFSYDLNNGEFKKGRGWEVKTIAIDELRNILYFADFSRKTIEKWDLQKFEPILINHTEGVIQSLVLSNDGNFLYAVYDDKLFIDEFSTEDLIPHRRLYIDKSGICGFGSPGMSIDIINDGRYLIAAFANCDRGIIKIDRTSMLPVLLAYNDHNMIWQVSRSFNDKSFFVCYPALDYIAEIDSDSLKVLRKITVGKGIRNILVSRDGRSIYVSNYFTGLISKIDTVSLRIIPVVRLPRKSYAIAEDPRTLDIYVGGPRGVWRISHIH